MVSTVPFHFDKNLLKFFSGCNLLLSMFACKRVRCLIVTNSFFSQNTIITQPSDVCAANQSKFFKNKKIPTQKQTRSTNGPFATSTVVVI